MLSLQARSCSSVGWAVVGVGPGGQARFVHEAIGDTFAWVGSPEIEDLDRLTLVVTGLEEPSSFEIWLDHSARELEILAPTETAVANVVFPVDADNPGTFLIAVDAEWADPTPALTSCVNDPPAAADRPVLRGGLDTNAFEVEIYDDDGFRSLARIVSGNYVGSEYWLTVEAPVVIQAGSYHLRVTVDAACKRNEATRENCVVYGADAVHHTVVVDASGSMRFRRRHRRSWPHVARRSST